MTGAGVSTRARIDTRTLRTSEGKGGKPFRALGEFFVMGFDALLNPNVATAARALPDFVVVAVAEIVASIGLRCDARGTCASTALYRFPDRRYLSRQRLPVRTSQRNIQRG